MRIGIGVSCTTTRLIPTSLSTNDKIVGVIDWEMAGFFGWNRAAKVHRQIRSPRRENYAHLNLDESFLADILYWNDLYDGETALKGPA